MGLRHRNSCSVYYIYTIYFFYLFTITNKGQNYSELISAVNQQYAQTLAYKLLKLFQDILRLLQFKFYPHKQKEQEQFSYINPELY